MVYNGFVVLLCLQPKILVAVLSAAYDYPQIEIEKFYSNIYKVKAFDTYTKIIKLLAIY